jgi:hypothetical protein
MNIQILIAKGLFDNSDYFKRVVWNIKDSYFDETTGVIIKAIKVFYEKYNKIPDHATVLTIICGSEKYSKSLKKLFISFIK